MVRVLLNEWTQFERLDGAFQSLWNHIGRDMIFFQTARPKKTYTFWWSGLGLGSSDGVDCRIFPCHNLLKMARWSLALAVFNAYCRPVLAKEAICFLSRPEQKRIIFSDTLAFFFGSDWKLLITGIYEEHWECLAHQMKGRRKVFFVRQACTGPHKMTRAFIVHQKIKK